MHASRIAYGSSSWLLYIAACMLLLIGRALDELGQFPVMSPMLLGILGCSELNHTFMEYARSFFLSFFLTLVLTYTSQVVPLKSLPWGHPIIPSIHNHSSQFSNNGVLPTSSPLVPPHFCQALHYTLASKTCLQPVGWGSTVSRLLWSIANAERLSRKQAEHGQWSISQGTKRESFKESRTYGSWLTRDSLLQRLRAKAWHKKRRDIGRKQKEAASSELLCINSLSNLQPLTAHKHAQNSPPERRRDP